MDQKLVTVFALIGVLFVAIAGIGYTTLSNRIVALKADLAQYKEAQSEVLAEAHVDEYAMPSGWVTYGFSDRDGSLVVIENYYAPQNEVIGLVLKYLGLELKYVPKAPGYFELKSTKPEEPIKRLNLWEEAQPAKAEGIR